MKKAVVWLLLILPFVSGQLLSLTKSTRLILNEIQKLEKIVRELDQRITALDRKIDMVDERVRAITRNQADQGANRETSALTLQFIKEELSELKRQVSRMNDRITSVSTTQSPDSGDSAIDTAQPVNQSPENIYYTAYSDYLKKNYDLAVKGFDQFIRLFPDNGLADNSLYWIGECYYSQKMYQEAVNAFSRLILRYRDGDKIPAATLKKGYALIEMGQQSEGIAILRDLMSAFPLSEEASLAQQKIREVTEIP